MDLSGGSRHVSRGKSNRTATHGLVGPRRRATMHDIADTYERLATK